MAHQRLYPTPLAAFSITDEDKVPAPIRNISDLYQVLFKQKKITQRAAAFNKLRYSIFPCKTMGKCIFGGYTYPPKSPICSHVLK